VPGWRWDAYVNYKQGDELDPVNSYAEPFLTAADDPVRQIEENTLKIETARWLKFRAWVHQTITVSLGTTVTVHFEIQSNAFSSLDRLIVKAGIDETGPENCYHAKWGVEERINQDDGIITLTSPEVEVGDGARVTMCFFAEPTYPHVNNAAFFDEAILIAEPPD
jgi:hypothetical protein